MKRSYSGGANASALTAPTTEITATLSVNPLVGWPDYTTGPFIITVDRGGPNEEKMLCSEYTTSSILVAQRGYDNTTAKAHSAGEKVEHTIAAVDVAEPNLHLNSAGGVHGLSVSDDIVGTIKPQTLLNKEIDGADNTITNLPQSSVVGLPDLAARTLPIGSITMYAGVGGVPGGWLICEGQAVSRTAFADLFAVIGTTYGAGDGSTTFLLPDLTARFPRGSATSNNVKGGAATKTLATGNLPSHQHGLAGHTHDSASHQHTIPALTHTLAGNVAIADHAARAHDHGGNTGNENQAGVMIATSDTMSPQAGSGRSNMVTGLPDHTHPITSDPGAAQAHTITQPVIAQHPAGVTGYVQPSATAGPNTSNTDATGSGTPVDILPPYIDIRFIILAVQATTGG